MGERPRHSKVVKEIHCIAERNTIFIDDQTRFWHLGSGGVFSPLYRMDKGGTELAGQRYHID